MVIPPFSRVNGISVPPRLADFFGYDLSGGLCGETDLTILGVDKAESGVEPTFDGRRVHEAVTHFFLSTGVRRSRTGTVTSKTKSASQPSMSLSVPQNQALAADCEVKTA